MHYCIFFFLSFGVIFIGNAPTCTSFPHTWLDGPMEELRRCRSFGLCFYLSFEVAFGKHLPTLYEWWDFWCNFNQLNDSIIPWWFRHKPSNN